MGNLAEPHASPPGWRLHHPIDTFIPPCGPSVRSEVACRASVLYGCIMAAEILPLFPVDRPVRLRAPAKVNLFLDILDRRPDGYHNLDAVNVSVSLFDEIDLTINDEGRHRIECDSPEIPTNEENHLIRAAEAILHGTRWGVSIHLKKRIPVGAGLGGGTADAGVLMRYLARAFNLDEKALIRKSLSVGSDVPYCLIGGNARVGGRGENLQRLYDLPTLRLVLLDPGLSHETRAIYGRLPPAAERRHPPADLLVEAWWSNSLELVGLQMFNAFQDLVFELQPRLAELRERLLGRGCLGVCLTGTGSHLVGLLGGDQPSCEEWEWDVPGTKITAVETLPGDFPGWFQRL